MKRCTKCGEEKPLSEFHRDARTRDGLRCWCKVCAVADTLRCQGEVIAAINGYKSRPCADCGQEYPYYVMDLDHVRGEKEFHFGYGRAARSLKKVLEELEKCDVVCSNCHRTRTFTREQHLTRGGALAAA